MPSKGRFLSIIRRLSCTLSEQPGSPTLSGALKGSGHEKACPSTDSADSVATQEASLCSLAMAPLGSPLPEAFPPELEDGGEALQEQLELMLRKCDCLPDREWLAAREEELILARCKLVSWLRVATLYHEYSIITAEHAAAILDRYLVSTDFAGAHTRQMQLAAVASFSLAAKMEEVYVPSLADEVQVAVPFERFTPKEIERMELSILTTLDWRLACVTPSDLVQPLLAASPAWCQHGATAAAAAESAAMEGDASPGCSRRGRRSLEWLGEGGQRSARQQLGAQVRTKAKGALAVSLADPGLARFKPSEVAAASLIIGVHGTCPDDLACSVQSSLLARFPHAAACVGVLLEHSPPQVSKPSTCARSAAPATQPSACAGSVATPGDTPAAKRYCRELTPTSVLDM